MLSNLHHTAQLAAELDPEVRPRSMKRAADAVREGAFDPTRDPVSRAVYRHNGDLRPVGGEKTCSLCNEVGHASNRCPQARAECTCPTPGDVASLGRWILRGCLRHAQADRAAAGAGVMLPGRAKDRRRADAAGGVSAFLGGRAR